ncbi:radical SAM family heme chaperone HemW [Deinococcus maricopensis]|uniref:Heme chaperone HemW n=1 Tax=Deinococcus maricopensis (strain DSM 21211 / LMG 22137 / NRRL B-23946 / LB-34) TaxID=709986 RepID=E8U3Z0_DEIML|nr:radical SAM family heme chaperone HemW [Deinococcus maricopensis]ADV65684.1 oxygen-independent coproporphyrinogen III oxidase [Deinococcus maricopensis DSM 21211]
MTDAPTVPTPPVVRHLYVHVPFCPTICPYCDFHVLQRRAGVVECYLAKLREDARALAAAYPVDLQTVYLGGGTPSFLRDAELADLVDAVRTHLGWGALENTLEVNPGTVSAARATHWRALGFDRASVGVQSLHDPTLKFLGRPHDAQAARDAVTTLLSGGFRVSGDLITAVEGQPLDEDVRGLVELGVEHVSAYTLTIEPGTPFARRGVQVSEDAERLGFERTEALLTGLGFERYEISNYARPGAHSRHNRAYWTNQHYLGLGPGAAGHYPVTGTPGVLGERRTNAHLHEWLAGTDADVDVVTPEEFVTDALFMGLRLRDGVDLADLTTRSGVDVAARYAPVIEQHVARGTLTLDGTRLRATPQGWWVLNQVIADFLNDEPTQG